MKMRQRKCRNCERLSKRMAELEKQLAAALARIEQLERQLAGARKDSSTSSKPPRPMPKSRTGRRRKRRRGGQPGHPRHERMSFPPETVDKIWIYEWPEASLNSDWIPLDEFQTIQQVDLVPKLLQVTEHRARLYLHRRTGEKIRFVVIDRKITQGTRGQTGQRWCERIWTLLATCAQQRRSAFEFLYRSIVANLRGQSTPQLLPAAP
jgi:hypothetical protein